MGLFYHIFYYPAKLALTVYFKKITIHNRSKIPAEGPVLIASNHPNSFMEAIIASCNMRRVSHFIVRGDVFKNPVAAFVLRSTNQIPIFRFKDGFSNLKKNESTMEYCYRKLKENQLIIIFSEGLCIQEKRLRPIQKGTARMAFGAYDEKGVDDLTIVPLGVNYVDGTEARTTVMCSYGEPLLLKDYLQLYKDNPNAAIRQLTGDIEIALSKLVIHIDHPEYDDTVDFLLNMKANNHPDRPMPIVELNEKRLQRELNLVRKFNSFEAEMQKDLQNKVVDYQILLKTLFLKDNVVSKISRGKILIKLISLTLLFPFFVPGILLLSWMYFLADYFTDKKVKSPEFKTSVRYGVMSVSYFFACFLLILAAVIFGKYILLLGIILMPIFGIATFRFIEIFRNLVLQLRWMNLGKEKKSEFQAQRKLIIDMID